MAVKHHILNGNMQILLQATAELIRYHKPNI